MKPASDPKKVMTEAKRKKLDEVMPWPPEYFGIKAFAGRTALADPLPAKILTRDKKKWMSPE